MPQEKRVRRTESDSDTKQVSDKDAGAWNIPYARAEFDEGIETDSVGELNDEPEDDARRKRRS